MRLTTEDLQKALNDERHLGFGYADSRQLVAPTKLAKLDRAVVALANEYGLDYEGLFAWANSKLGRWLMDEVYGSGQPPTQETVRRYLNLHSLAEIKEA